MAQLSPESSAWTDLLLDRLPGSHLTHEAANQLSAHRKAFIFELPDEFSGADSRHLSMPMVNPGHDGLLAQLLVHGSFCGFVVDLRWMCISSHCRSIVAGMLY